MTERTATDAGAIACPFVAFEDDRDERADRPDHRHRCYAEIRPAPRALAHQEAFCLSPGFATCPTFQDWARREAARARGTTAAAAGHEELAGLARGSADRTAEPAAEGPSDADLGDLPVRNPPRDWAAPPPWADFAAASADAEPPAFLTPRSGRRPEGADAEAAGLAGSRWLQGAGPDAGDAGAAGGPPDPGDDLERSLAEDRARRERVAPSGAVAATAAAVPLRSPSPRAPAARPAVSDTRRPTPRNVAGPAWERPHRYEAYPTLKTRVGLPNVPRIALAALALLVAAVVLFSLPFVLGLGGGGGASSTPTPTPQPSVSVAPSEALAPTARIYVVKQGDTVTKIAKKFGLSVEELLAANKQIKNPNNIAIGDELTIPPPAPDEIVDGAASPSP